MSESIVKLCVICHQSVVKKPRVKDSKGNYYCRACYDRTAVAAEDDMGEGGIDLGVLTGVVIEPVIRPPRPLPAAPEGPRRLAIPTKLFVAGAVTAVLAVVAVIAVVVGSSSAKSPSRAAAQSGHADVGAPGGNEDPAGNQRSRPPHAAGDKAPDKKRAIFISLLQSSSVLSESSVAPALAMLNDSENAQFSDLIPVLRKRLAEEVPFAVVATHPTTQPEYVKISPNGKTILLRDSPGHHRPATWSQLNLDSGEWSPMDKMPRGNIHFLDDHNIVGTARSVLFVTDLRTMESRPLTVPNDLRAIDGVAAVSADGKHIAFSMAGRSPDQVFPLYIVDPSADKIVQTIPPADRLMLPILFCKNDRSLVVESGNGGMKLIDLATQQWSDSLGGDIGVHVTQDGLVLRCAKVMQFGKNKPPPETILTAFDLTTKATVYSTHLAEDSELGNIAINGSLAVIIHPATSVPPEALPAVSKYGVGSDIATYKGTHHTFDVIVPRTGALMYHFDGLFSNPVAIDVLPDGSVVAIAGSNGQLAVIRRELKQEPWPVAAIAHCDAFTQGSAAPVK